MDLSDIKYLNTIPIFANLELDYLAETFGADSNIRKYKCEENIFTSGDSVSKLYIVKSGWVRLFCNSSDGKEVTSAVYSEGALFDESTIMPDSAVHDSTCQSLEESILIEVPIRLIKNALEGNHVLACDLLLYMSSKMSKVGKRTEHLCMMTSPQRVGCFLLQLYHHQRDKSLAIKLPVKKGIIASYLGMNFETFSRSLNKLKSIDVTIDGDSVIIDDITKIERYVCVSCSGERRSEHCFI